MTELAIRDDAAGRNRANGETLSTFQSSLAAVAA